MIKIFLILILTINTIYTTTVPPDNNSRGIYIGITIGITEFYAAGFSAISLLKYGDKINAASQGCIGVAGLVLPAFVNNGTIIKRYSEDPELPVMGLAMLGLSYYNWKYGKKQSKQRVFWTNFIAYNAITALYIGTAYANSKR